MELVRIIDGFCPEIDQVRQSALDSGFGKWTPNKGEVGSSIYEGMNYTGKHSYMLKAIAIRWSPKLSARHPWSSRPPVISIPSGVSTTVTPARRWFAAGAAAV